MISLEDISQRILDYDKEIERLSMILSHELQKPMHQWRGPYLAFLYYEIKLIRTASDELRWVCSKTNSTDIAVLKSVD